MSHETRQVNPGHEYNTTLKLAILQYGGVLLHEGELWIYVSWPDEETWQRFEEDRSKSSRRQEEIAS